jgi:hypothetical protein
VVVRVVRARAPNTESQTFADFRDPAHSFSESSRMSFLTIIA